MINITNISKSYKKGEKVLDDITFSLPKGTLTSIVGPSGCGKTTLLKILAGFLEPDQGKVFMGNKDVTHLSIQERKTGMVFQDYALWPHMTIFQNVAYGLKLNKCSKDEIQKRVFEMLDIVEIDRTVSKERYPTQLSGGQQQRVSLARALVVNPDIILLDEPLSNLDAKVRMKLRFEIRRIQKLLNLTAIYVTHDQEEALSMSDQVVLLNNGVIEQFGTPDTIYNTPHTQFVAEFLGNSNCFNGVVESTKVMCNGIGFGNRNLKNGRVKIIFRAEQARINYDKEKDIIFSGEIIDKMFIGSAYRYFIQIQKQSMFIDLENDIEKGQIIFGIPKDKIYIYDNN